MMSQDGLLQLTAYAHSPPTVTEILLTFFMVPLDFEKGVAELWDIR